MQKVVLQFVLGMGLWMGVSGGAWGQSIFGNPITGTNPNTDNPYITGQVVNSNIAVSGIGRGPGINGTNANDRYNANAWNSMAFDVNKYFYFILTPNSGYEIDFVSFVYTGQASETGPTSFAFRSSVDGFSSNIGSPTATGATISLTGSEYQNVTSSIEFRLYGWGASGAAGTFSVNDFAFNGSVNFLCTPPTTQAINFNATNLLPTQMEINWVRGNGDNVLVLARQGSAVNADPVDGVGYTANAAFGNGLEIGSGNFVVYSGSGTSVTVTGLMANMAYHYAIYEFNSLDNCYLKPGLTGNAVTLPSPGLSVNPAILNGFSYVEGSGPSVSQAYVLTGSNLLPSDDMITITVGAPGNYEVSTDDMTFSSSINVSYSGGVINAVIYVRLKAGLLAGTYNGEIVTNSGGGASTQNVTCNGMVMAVPITMVYSQGSGGWATVNLWNTESDGSGTPVTAPDDVGISVVIQSGHMITLATSSYKVENLTINTGGILQAGGSMNRFISVYGSSITVNGTAGGSGDGLGFSVEGPNCVMTGSGNISPSRIKKEDNSALGSATTNFSIENCTVNLSWSTSGALYNNSSPNTNTARTFNVTIANNATVNVVGDVSINGPLGNNSFGDVGTFTVNGTLNIGRDLLVRTRATVGNGIQYVVNGTVDVGRNVVGNSDNTGTDIASVVVNNGGVLRLKGNGDMFTLVSVRETYNLNAGSEMDYNNSSPQTIRQFTYSNLTSSGGGNKALVANTTVNGILDLQSGNTVLGNHNLTLGSSASINGGFPSSYIVTDGPGVLRRTVGPSSSVFFPVGPASYFMPATLLTGGSHASDVFSVRVEPLGSPPVTISSAKAARCIQYQWIVDEQLTGGSSANLQFQWAPGTEGVSFNPGDMPSIGRWDGTEFNPVSPAGYNATDPSFTSNNPFTSFSPFVVASDPVALPIQLLSFHAEKRGSSALLTWRTASEQDNDYMAVERSADARYWEELGRVPGAGTTTVPQDYQYLDEKPLPGANYYRLRQVDYDGSYEYHRVVTLYFDAGRAEAGIAPNPVQERLLLNFSFATAEDAEVLIMDMQGRALKRGIVPAGSLQWACDLGGLPAGMYVVQLREAGYQEVLRFVKE